MASDSYPRPAFNSGQVVEALYERLTSPQAPDGLIGMPTNPPLAFTDGVGTRQVRIRANRRALVRGFQYDSGSADITITLPGNTSGTTRVDLVVLRLDRSTWRVQENYVQGTPGQGAPAPADTSLVFDFPVAAVSVPHNATTLAPAATTARAWYVGSDGQVVCTEGTRPSHEAGRRIFEVDTGRAYISTGSTWLHDADDSGSLTLPMNGGWTANFNRLRRRSGWVFLALSPQRTGGNLGDDATSTVGTLPGGFRPYTSFEGLAHAPSSGAARVVVNTSGSVQVVLYGGLDTNKFVNFHPISFPVA